MTSDRPLALVTGGAGFLGSQCVHDLLNRRYAVRLLDLPGTDFDRRLSDVLNHPDLAVAECDVLQLTTEDAVFAGVDKIFHCAGIADHRLSLNQPELFMNVHLGATVRILEAARHHNISMTIHTSTAAVYGAPDWPTKEDHPVSPENPYGLSKVFAEMAGINWHRFYNVPIISMRIFNGYGPGLPPSSGVVGIFIEKRRKGEPIQIFGNGGQKRDFIYISDISDALIRAGERGRPGEIYNIGTGKPRTLLEMARLFECEIEFVPTDENVFPVNCAETSKIRDHLEWSPNVSIEEGVERILQTIKVEDN